MWRFCKLWQLGSKYLMLEMSQQLTIGPSEYDEHPAIPTILVLIRLSRWTDPIFAFPCALQPAAEGPSSALSSRPCDISWAHLSGLPKRWHFFGGFPGQSFQGALLYSWVVERRLILTGSWSDGQHLSRARILISDVNRCYMIVFQCSHTPPDG